MKKAFRILADLNMAVVGLLFAWICFEGSARTIGMYLILWGSVVYFINEYTKKEDNNGDTQKCSNENCSGNCC